MGLNRGGERNFPNHAVLRYYVFESKTERRMTG